MNLYELIYIFKKIFKHLFISLYRVLVAHGLFVWLQFSSVHSLSCARLFATPWTAAHQASLSITPSWSFLKLMSIVSVMPSNHLILCPDKEKQLKDVSVFNYSELRKLELY